MLARLRYLEEQTYPLVFSQELTPSEPALVSWTIDIFLRHKRGFPNSSVGKESACNVGNPGIPGLGRSPGEGNGNHSSILAWTIPWTEDLVGYSPWGRKESDTTVTFLYHQPYCHCLSSFTAAFHMWITLIFPLSTQTHIIKIL